MIYDALGRKIPAGDISFVNRVIDLKKKSGSNPWPVIEGCIKFWRDKRRKRWDAYLIHIDDTRETRRDSKFASVHDRANDGYLRYTLDIPQEIIYMIRCIYSPDELPMDKQSGFFKEFAKRFPVFRVAQKI